MALGEVWRFYPTARITTFEDVWAESLSLETVISDARLPEVGRGRALQVLVGLRLRDGIVAKLGEDSVFRSQDGRFWNMEDVKHNRRTRFVELVLSRRTTLGQGAIDTPGGNAPLPGFTGNTPGPTFIQLPTQAPAPDMEATAYTPPAGAPAGLPTGYTPQTDWPFVTQAGVPYYAFEAQVMIGRTGSGRVEDLGRRLRARLPGALLKDGATLCWSIWNAAIISHRIGVPVLYGGLYLAWHPSYLRANQRTWDFWYTAPDQHDPETSASGDSPAGLWETAFPIRRDQFPAPSTNRRLLWA
ncbi:MAG: hypothetical protein OXG44_06205, partial [Gammaproteobacteria bacterium]|nr:hypothetical protein [Gammaproteobacteria bacterium]